MKSLTSLNFYEVSNAKTSNGENAFHFAAQNTNVEVFGFLAKKMKEVFKDKLLIDGNLTGEKRSENSLNILLSSADNQGRTFMHKFHSRAYSDNYRKYSDYDEVFDILNSTFTREEFQDFLARKTSENVTDLMLSAQFNKFVVFWNRFKIVFSETSQKELLLQEDSNGLTAFHYLFCSENTFGNVYNDVEYLKESIKIHLTELGAEKIHQIILKKNNNEESLLDFAMKSNKDSAEEFTSFLWSFMQEKFNVSELIMFNFGIHDTKMSKGLFHTWLETQAGKGSQEVSSCIVMFECFVEYFHLR